MDHTCIIRGLNATSRPAERRPIARHRAVSVSARRGTVIRAESGALWLTQEGNSEDYILVPGAQYLSLSEGTIVVSAFDAGGVILVTRLEPVPGHGLHGSPLRIDRAAIKRIEHEARAARARLMKEWAGRLLMAVWAGLRRLTGSRATRAGNRRAAGGRLPQASLG